MELVKEFLLQNKSLITRIIEIMAAVTGLLYYKKYKPTAAKYFIFFLVYLSICDFINTYSKYTVDNKIFSFLEGTLLEKNHWWSTLFWKIGAIAFFAFYYQKVLRTKQFKAILKYVGYGFVLFSLIYIGFNFKDFFIKFFPIISVLGAFIIFLCVTLYFIEVLSSEKVLSFYTSLNFYVSCAIFIWWLIITPLIFYDIYASALDWNFVFLKWQIYLFANIFMYSTFTFGLIYSKPEHV